MIVSKKKSNFQKLKIDIQQDPSYAWSIHCNLAMPIMDSLHVTHAEANLAAAALMHWLWDVDMAEIEEFKATFSSN